MKLRPRNPKIPMLWSILTIACASKAGAVDAVIKTEAANTEYVALIIGIIGSAVAVLTALVTILDKLVNIWIKIRAERRIHSDWWKGKDDGTPPTEA